MNDRKLSHSPVPAWTRDWLVLAAAVLFAAWALAGISCANLLTLLLVAAVISLLNTFLKPLLLLASIPFLAATFGLGTVLVLWLINSFFLYFAGALFNGFHVASFGTAMLGAIFIGAAQFCLNLLFGIQKKRISFFGAGTGAQEEQGDAEDAFPPPHRQPRSRRESDDDVIDI